MPKKRPLKKPTKTPNRVSAILKSSNARYVRRKMKDTPKGSIKEVLDSALDHVQVCQKA